MDAVVAEISSRLNKYKNDNLGVKQAIDFSPVGWDYWSFGIPAPLVDYINYEFKDDLINFIRG